MHEELPTVPGLPVIPRVRRQFDRSFDAVAFDLPIVPVSYIGVRKSELTAYRRQTAAQTKILCAVALGFAALYALIELSYHGWL